MQERHLYEYAVIRFVPKVERGGVYQYGDCVVFQTSQIPEIPLYDR